MPYTVDPNSHFYGRSRTASIEDTLGEASYDYDYPEGLDLEPGSELHDLIVSEVTARARESYQYMNAKHSKWREIDDVLQTYVRPERRAGGDDNEKSAPHQEIIMPYSYANLQTLQTYMAAAFLKDPIFEFKGVSPNDIKGAMLMQQVINLHTRRHHIGLNLLTMFRDSFAYGIGAVSPRWKQQYGKKTLRKEVGVVDRMRQLFLRTGQEKTTSERELIFEGNNLANIDPYRYLPDPNTPAAEVQEGEFVGWVDRTHYMALLGDEGRPDSMYFNVKYLSHFDPRSSILLAQGEERDHEAAAQRNSMSRSNPVDVTWMYIDLIPSEWGLGSQQYPEKWMFGVAGDQVVISAKPLGMTHGEFPVCACAPDTDGHSPMATSRMEQIFSMQKLSDFLFTSHIQNVRKTVNNQFVVDPRLVNIYDVMNPEPGKVIRARRSSFGENAVERGIRQLDVQDVTRGNVQDAMMMQDVMQGTTSATDNLQGRVAGRTTRISASEVQASRQSGLSRLEMAAQVISMQAMQPIARQFAHNAQQYMDTEAFVEIVGDRRQRLEEQFNMEVNRGRIEVNPFDILVDYDVVPNDGTIPGQADGELWVNLFQILSQSPQVAQNFDLVNVFKHTAEQLGAQDVERFELSEEQAPQVQQMEDQDVQQEVQKGNLVPQQGPSRQRGDRETPAGTA